MNDVRKIKPVNELFRDAVDYRFYHIGNMSKNYDSGKIINSPNDFRFKLNLACVKRGTRYSPFRSCTRLGRHAILMT